MGAALERRIGSLRFGILYWVSGTLGILASTLILPQYVSSGSSQALMGVCAGVLILKGTLLKTANWVNAAAWGTLAFQVALDLFVSHSLKPGHVTGFLVGTAIAFFFRFGLASTSASGSGAQL